MTDMPEQQGAEDWAGAEVRARLGIATPEGFVTRLHKEIRRSKAVLTPFMRKRKLAIERFAGADYGRGVGPSNPFNMSYAAISTLVPLLVTRNPRSDVLTDHQEFRPLAYRFERLLDVRYPQIRLADTLRKVVVDSIFGHGCSRVMLEDVTDGPPRATIKRISPKRLLFDAEAEDTEEMRWIGHQYDLDQVYAHESGMLENLGQLEQTGKSGGGGADDPLGLARVGREKGGDATERMTYEVIDVYVPPGTANPWVGLYTTGLILTIPVEGQGNKPLRITEWRQDSMSPTGPYEVLQYYRVPDEPYPLAPAAAWGPLDKLINTLSRKLEAQVRRSKDVWAYEPAVATDMKNLRDATDGEAVAVRSVDQIKAMSMGGPNDKLYVFMQYLVQMFSRHAKNVNLLGGLASDARTATEATLLQGNADVGMADMQGEVYNFTERTIKKFAWFEWENPDLEQYVTLEDKGSGTELTVMMTQEYLDMVKAWIGQNPRFQDFAFQIRPYSMSIDPPEARAEKLLGLVERVIFPTMQLAAAQGSMLNVDSLVATVAQELQIPEIDELYIPGTPVAGLLAEPVTAPGGTQGDQGRQPRISVNAGTAARGGTTPQMPAQQQPAQMGAPSSGM